MPSTSKHNYKAEGTAIENVNSPDEYRQNLKLIGAVWVLWYDRKSHFFAKVWRGIQLLSCIYNINMIQYK